MIDQGETSASPLSLSLGSLMEMYWDSVEQKGQPVSTGIGVLDDTLGGGLFPGRLIGLLGRPGSGKSTLSNQIAYHVASTGCPALYLSLEESLSSVIAKTISREFDLEYGSVLRGDRALKGAINDAFAALSSQPVASGLKYIFPSSETSRDLLNVLYTAAASQFADSHQGGLIVVDYLQDLAHRYRATHPEDRRELRECVGWLAGELRQLACDLNCTVLMLSSVSRLNGYAMESPLSSAKESGDIEYICDAVLALQPARSADAGGSGRLGASSAWTPYELEVAKNRGGETRKLTLMWRGDRQTLTDKQPMTMSSPILMPISRTAKSDRKPASSTRRKVIRPLDSRDTYEEEGA